MSKPCNHTVQLLVFILLFTAKAAREEKDENDAINKKDMTKDKTTLPSLRSQNWEMVILETGKLNKVWQVFPTNK